MNDRGMRGGSGWLNTSTGRKVYPLDPDPDEIDIRDIAKALAHQARYAGHTEKPLSVAQHSVIVSRLVPREDALWGLLHDAPEAFLTDLPRPLKRLPEFAFYREAEARLMAAICRRFGLPLEEPASVREIDARMVPTESRDLFPNRNGEWRDHAEPLPIRIRAWPHDYAERAFLDRFETLTRAASAAV